MIIDLVGYSLFAAGTDRFTTLQKDRVLQSTQGETAITPSDYALMYANTFIPSGVGLYMLLSM
jgi:hypothetical protein